MKKRYKKWWRILHNEKGFGKKNNIISDKIEIKIIIIRMLDW